MVKSGLLFLGLLVIPASCMREPGYLSLMQEVPPKGWSRHDTLTMEMAVRDSLLLYHIDLIGRLRSVYDQDSLSVVLRVYAPNGTSFTDTLSFGVTHAYDRIWEDFRFGYCSHVCFTQKGIWRFDLWHHMNTDMLKGVFAIGLYIKREDNGKK